MLCDFNAKDEHLEQSKEAQKKSLLLQPFRQKSQLGPNLYIWIIGDYTKYSVRQ